MAMVRIETLYLMVTDELILISLLLKEASNYTILSSYLTKNTEATEAFLSVFLVNG
jgi:hypothetical protein